MLVLAFARYKLPAELLAALALLCAIAFGFHEFCERERDIGRNEVRAEYAEKLRLAKDAADKREEELRGQVADAITKGNQREETIRTLATANSTATQRMRDTITSVSNSLSSLSADALRSLASTYGNIYTKCDGERSGFATEAERLNSEKRTLIESWPKNSGPSK
jgi:hypothetical protein